MNGLRNSKFECKYYGSAKCCLGICSKVNDFQTISHFEALIIFYYNSIKRTVTPCRTPDNRNGTCIVLQECRVLYEQLSGSLSTEQRSFLRRSQCGHDGTNPLVCCPNAFTVDDLLSVGKCGVFFESRILGGERAYPGEYPWYEFNSNE